MEAAVASWRRLTFIEPVIFCIMFSFSISDSVITDAIVYKTCIKLLKQNISSNCSILYENSSSESAKELQTLIQPYTASVVTLKSCIETLFPTILILFLGPWSDTNGRKPLLIFPFFGSIIYYSLYSVLSMFDTDPHWFLIPSTISSLLGGFPSILLTSFCYVSDVTNGKNRTWRLGFLDFVLFGGQLVGFVVSPVLFQRFGYCTVFATSAVSCLLGLLYSYFLLKETIYTGTGTSLTTLFDISLLKDLIRTVTKKRSGFDRGLIWCCLVIIALHDDMMQGTATIVYLFTKRFGWSLLDFSLYSVIHLSVTMVGMLLLIKLIVPLCHLSETTGIIIASLSHCGGSLTKAFANRAWYMYLSTCIGLFSLSPASLVRSIISQTVPPYDIGKVFAVTTTMEKIGPFITTPLFVYLYTNYIKEYPCPVWFLPAGFSIGIIVLAIDVERRWRELQETRMEGNRVASD